MGQSAELARGAIRVSTGHATSEADIDRLLNVWQKLTKSLSMQQKRGLAA
jgi:cysteine sulfinate desulfinase/cysteine desulfurase-like protein